MLTRYFGGAIISRVQIAAGMSVSRDWRRREKARKPLAEFAPGQTARIEPATAAAWARIGRLPRRNQRASWSRHGHCIGRVGREIARTIWHVLNAFMPSAAKSSPD